MKKALAFISCISLLLIACGSQKSDELNKMAEVLKIHDRVMAHDEALIKNKMQIENLLKVQQMAVADSGAEKLKMKAIDKRLNAADQNMESWMHQFDPEQKSKSHQEIMDYLDKQKKTDSCR